MHENTESPHNSVVITPNSQQQIMQYKINLLVLHGTFYSNSMFSSCKCLHEQASLTPPRSVCVIAGGHGREGLHSNNAFEPCACLPTCQLAVLHKSSAICSGVNLQPGNFIVIVSSEALRVRTCFNHAGLESSLCSPVQWSPHSHYGS